MRSQVLSMALVALCSVLSSGCVSLSGLGGSSSLSCKAPEGVQCESLSGVYANMMAGNLPGQRPAAPAASAGTPYPAPTAAQRPTISSGTPLRAAPVVMRLWIAPWEDHDGDLHDQSYVYLTVSDGAWQIEHNRAAIVRQAMPHADVQAAPSGAPASPVPAPQGATAPLKGLSPGMGQGLSPGGKP